jgi:POT family proton-dependent oligopeptide transporter
MAASRTDQIRHARPELDFFGHPRGLTFLFATAMWERFAYYGMQALLNLYMVKYLLLPEHADGVLGLGALRSMIDTGSGPLAAQPLASQIYGLYLALIALAPIIGGLIADQLIGARRAVIIGAALMTAGHFLLVFDRLFLVALATLVIANGMFQPCILSQVGDLYRAVDPRRDRGYTIFYAAIGIGALLAPPVCGTLGEEWGWHYGFAAAGSGMLIGLAVYLYAARALPAKEMHRGEPLPAGGFEWRSALALATFFLPATLLWATYAQQGNTIALWADDYTDRTINLWVWHGEIPVTWFAAFNPLLMLALTPLVISLWSRQQESATEPSTIVKMALGSLAVALSYLIMAGAAWSAAGDEASWWWLAAYFVTLALGGLYFAPIGLSLVSKAAPPGLVSMTMGLWLATSFAGNVVSGWLGSLWSEIAKPSFFLMLAGLAALAGAAIFALNRSLRGALGD